ncbi:MAG TPA: carboxyl transferase domain-containing protein, partial [Candidatus Binatus sp.]|nr:carboxyl transferase domain-containing protein [Candidatus Binatus sp.]
MSMKDRTEELEKKRSNARLGGGAAKIEEQHARGKMTARERVEALVDPDSFVEVDRFVLHQTRDFGM